MTSLEKDTYSNILYEMADTVLYETALAVLQEVRREGYSPSHACHVKNSLIYSEFWRREKAKYYYQAHNLVNKNNPLNFVGM